MTLKKYKINTHFLNTEITPVDVLRETETSVYLTESDTRRWPNGRRELKKTHYVRYFDSWEDAHASLLSAASGRVEKAKAVLSRAEAVLREVQSMTRDQAVDPRRKA